MFRIGAVQVNRPCLLGHEEEQKLSLFMETQIDPFRVNLCMWYKVRMQLHSFVCGYLLHLIFNYMRKDSWL